MFRRPLPRGDARRRTIGDGYPVWAFLAQLVVVQFVLIDWGSLGQTKFSNPKPHFVIAASLAAGAVLLAPRRTGGSVRMTASIWLFVSWWVLTVLWAPSFGEWVNATITQFGSLAGLMVVGSLLPVDRLRAAWLGSLYFMIGYTYFFTLTHYSTATVLTDPTNGGLVNVGWHGPFNHKNNLAAYALCAAIMILAFERVQWRRRLGAGLAVLLVVLTRSGTGAGGMIATFLVFGLAGYYGKRSARKGSAMVTVVALVSAVSAAIAAVFLPSILGLYGKDLTFSNRTNIWEAVIPAIDQRLWRGYSLGGVWVNGSTEPTVTILRTIGFQVFHAHNGALEMMLEIGLAGFLLYLLVLVSTIVHGARVLRVEPSIGQLTLGYCTLVVIGSVTEVLTLGPWLSMLAMLCVLSLRLRKEADRGAPPVEADAAQASASRSLSTRAPAASAIARNPIPDRFAISSSDFEPSDWLSTQSTPISTERASIAPPIAE